MQFKIPSLIEWVEYWLHSILLKIQLLLDQATQFADTHTRFQQHDKFVIVAGEMLDWDENEQAIMEDIIPDGKGSLNHLVWNHWKRKAIQDALEKLSWREQTILKARNAICSNCGGMMPKKEQFQFQEIGKRIMKGATEKGAEVTYHAALDRLAVQLIEDGACHIVDLHLENLEQTENKNTAATYLYRVDCDGEWGEIRFDFENKRIKIQRKIVRQQGTFTPLDTPNQRNLLSL